MRAQDNEISPAKQPQVLVLGMGATGASCARYLATRGVAAVFADTREAPPQFAEIRRVMPAARCYMGGTLAQLPAGVQRVIVSPGVDLDLPALVDARRRGVEILGDLDVFVREATAPAIGITGSNGKSTVTSMTGTMLAAAGRRVAVGANLGPPALDLLDDKVQTYVLELSSFQLERSQPLPLQAAVVLNVAADHLDKHGTMAAYAAAKARIYSRCGIAVINADAPGVAAMVPRGIPTLSFGLSKPASDAFGIVVAGNREFLALGAEQLMPVTDLATTGRHNVSNALAALALGSAAGGSLVDMLTGLRSFRGLPHRTQRIETADGIQWIDDSKATNVAAAVTSIRGIDGPLILIAGGDGKGQSFEDLAKALRGRDAVAILIGRDREQMSREIADACTVEFAPTLQAAVTRARELARPGYTVLLAPACSSLDMFRNYEQRGEMFARAVREVTA